MNILRKTLSCVIVFTLLLHSIVNTVYAIPDIPIEKPIKIGIFLVDLSNVFNSALKKNLEELQKENNGKVDFSIFDSKSSQAIQNEDIARELDSNFDLFVVAPVSSNEDEIKNTFNTIIQAGIPFIVYFPTTSSLINIVKSYPRSIIISGDNNEAGTLEGKILANIWNSNKETLDKNKDNTMQYIMLQGPSNNILTSGRSKYSIRSLTDAGIKTEQLFSTVCNWQKDCAKSAIEASFLTLSNKIEAIIANNDNMAIGAVEALQKYGYNINGSSKYIPVVGIGGTPEAIKLINQGSMSGTVVQDSNLHAKAFYTIGKNLINGNSPIKDTNYQLDDTGTTIKIPYYEYVK